MPKKIAVKNNYTDYVSSLTSVNPSILGLCNFNDDVWRFSANISIYWHNLPERLGSINESDYFDFVPTLKRLAYLLLTDRKLKPKTISSNIRYVKEFVIWLLVQPIPIKRFKDVNQSDLSNYVKYLDEQKRLNSNNLEELKRKSIHVKKFPLSYLFKYKSLLEDYIESFPPNFFEITDRKHFYGDVPFGSKTEIIEDKILQEIFQNALNFIRENADDILKKFIKFLKWESFPIQNALASDPLINLSAGEIENIKSRLCEAIMGSYNTESLSLSRVKFIEYISEITVIPFNICVELIYKTPLLIGKLRLKDQYAGRRLSPHLAPNQRWMGEDLERNLMLLQTSCFVIIAVSTGMRLSELLAINVNALAEREVKELNHKLYWIESRIFKTSSQIEGETAFWICGDIAAEAVNVLERLYKTIPSTLISLKSKQSMKDSLFRSYIWHGGYIKARPISSAGIYRNISLFLAAFNIEIKQVRPHQFRRAFAVNAVRHHDLSIVALKRHFKHVSILMTDYYVGVDHDLVRLYFEEQLKVSDSLLTKIVKGECAGPGGIIANKRLQKMLDKNETSTQYLGNVKLGNIDKLVKEFSELGLMAYKCGEFTTCLYVASSAKCGEGGPKEHECHPTECSNSYILIDDVPFYLQNIRQNFAAMKLYQTDEKDNPIKLFYLRRIQNDIKAIQLLIPDYILLLKKKISEYNLLTNYQKTHQKLQIQQFEDDLMTINQIPVYMNYEKR